MLPKPLLLCGALLLAACEDVPLLPRWDADFTLPIASQGRAWNDVFGGSIPISPVGPVPITTPVETQPLDDAIGDLLEDNLRGAALIFTVSSTIPLDGADTLFLAGTATDLTVPGNRIQLPFTLSSTAASTTDTVTLSQAEVDRLSNWALNGLTLHVQLRGSVTYSGPAPRTVTASDSLLVHVQCRCTLAVSR